VKHVCLVCQNEISEVFAVREMQLGLRETFEYGLCDRCGAISRLSEVANLSSYYPLSYHLFRQQTTKGKTLKSWLTDRRDRALLTERGTPLTRFLDWLSHQDVTVLYRLVGRCHIGPTARVLDVGCATGRLLRRMAELGFQNLTGVDLFAPEDALPKAPGLRIVKGEMTGLHGETFDLIMMHHSLEHCPDQRRQLSLALNLLAPGGMLLIRQPLCDSEVFRTYRANWCQIDSPRHAVLHSLNSMQLLAGQCGLSIEEIIWDSTDMQFWGSEQYARDVPLNDEKSYLRDPERGLFTSREIRAWRKEAAMLNRRRAGDQAVFYLRRAS
jgi:SAM-dependent methyltransferase